MKITTIGIDLAKSVFQVHGVDAQGNTVLMQQIKRDEMTVFFVNLSPCLIGMEACGGAHYWARKLQSQGHTVKLMAPQFVKPYVGKAPEVSKAAIKLIDVGDTDSATDRGLTGGDDDTLPACAEIEPAYRADHAQRAHFGDVFMALEHLPRALRLAQHVQV